MSHFYYTGGKLSSIATAGPRTTAFTVSGGDLTQVVNPDGGTRSFSYASHRLAGETFANLVNSWSYRADSTLETLRWGSNVNQITTITPAAVQGLYGLVAGEPLAVQADPLGRVTTWRLDLLGRLLEQRAADVGLWQWGRNSQSWIISATDSLGRTTSYTLDPQGYTTLETLPDTRTRAYQYQAAFHALTRFTDERNYSTTYTYDGLGHLRTVVNPLNQTTTYNYYQAGSATPGLLQSVVNARTYTTAYLYESGTRRLSKVTDARSGEVLYTYDDNGHVQTIRDQLLRTTTLVHDALGRRRDFGYDNADRLTSDTWIAAGGTVDTLSNSYDNNNVLTAGSGHGTYTLTYDPLDRRETQAGLFGLTLTYTYNAADDRI